MAHNVVDRNTPGVIAVSKKATREATARAGDLVCPDGMLVLQHVKDESGYGFYHVKVERLFCVSFYDDTGTNIVSQYQTQYPAGQEVSFQEPFGLACGAC